ncbi:MAG: 50S ribosomal protein L11 methyltransferase [Clostridiales bacterium]|nr:50S ribosomal protein L11 methyltransferase [Clostridiales bacterium]
MSEVRSELDWTEVTIETTSEGVEAITEALYEAGVKGVQIHDPHDIELLRSDKGDWDCIEESLLIKGRDVLVKGYLANNQSVDENIHIIKDRLRWLIRQDLGIDLGSGALTITNVRENDWANSWKKHFKPRKIGKFIVIKPSWENYLPLPGEIVLEMDPGMAFGTGTHETTILCVKALEDRVNNGIHLLDVGCGTGILAIAGLLLGADRAVAVDNDIDAIDSTRKNALRNGIDNRMNIIHGNLMENVNGRFDIVVSNIIADTIIFLVGNIKKFLVSKGIFIASGIILDRIDDTVTAIKKAGLTHMETVTMGEWASVVCQNE